MALVIAIRTGDENVYYSFAICLLLDLRVNLNSRPHAQNATPAGNNEQKNTLTREKAQESLAAHRNCHNNTRILPPSAEVFTSPMQWKARHVPAFDLGESA